MSDRPENIIPITPDARSAAEKFGAAHDRELLTILFTDMVDSTKLQSDLGNIESARLTELHRTIVRDELRNYDAREIEWAGDSCLAVFTKPSDGIVFALKLQAVLRESRRSEPNMPAIRIGLHLGEIVVRRHEDGGKRTEDLFGLQVSEAARIMSLARGDQIYCTRPVFDNARGSLKGQSIEGVGEIAWRNYGLFELKGSDDPAEVCEVGEEGVAPLTAPEANDKCRPIRGDLEKWRKRRMKGQQHRAGMPVWVLPVGLVTAVLVGAILGRGLAPSTGSERGGDAPIRSLAVLPFENYSGDPAQDYRVDGMTDTLTAELAKIGSIIVKARTSAMRYKNTDKTFEEIARELGVDGLIEGSIQQVGNDIVITAQLIDGRTGNHVWADNFDGTIENILRLQGEVAVAIAKEINAVLTPEERERYDRAKTVDPEAWDLYLRARDAWRGRTELGFSRAIELLDQATRVDSQFADAYALLALVHAALPFNQELENDQAEFARAEEVAKRALALDPEAIDAHYALAWAAWPGRLDRQEGHRHLATALDLDPNNAYGRFIEWQYLLWSGRLSEGTKVVRRATELDPLYPLYWDGLEQALRREGRYEEALSVLEHLNEIQPGFRDLEITFVLLYADMGDRARAIEALSEVQDDEMRGILDAYILASAGRVDEAHALLEVIGSQYDYDNRGIGLRVLHKLRRTDDALARLEYLESIGDWNTFLSGATQLGWDDAWDNPRYWKILARANIPPFPPEHPAYEAQQRYLADQAAKRVLAAQPKPVRRYAVDLGHEYPLAPESGFRSPLMAVSRDGSRLVYESTGSGIGRQLVLRERDRLEVNPIPGTGGAQQPFFSPDGAQIGFYADNEWKVIPIGGGPALSIAQASFPAGAVWCDDGSIIIGGSVREGLNRFLSTGERLEAVTRVLPGTDDAVHAMPSLLPEGKGLLYTVSRAPGIESTRVEALCFETGQRIVIATEASIPRYVPTGHIVYVKTGALMAVPFSIDEFRTTGPAVAIPEFQLADASSVPSAYAIADDGTLWYGSRGVNSVLRDYIWIDLEGNEEPTGIEPRPQFPLLSISPDGMQVALGDGRDIYTIDLNRGTPSRLTFDDVIERWPNWGPDGEYVYYSVYKAPAFAIRKKLANGLGEAEEIYQGDGTFLPRTWLPTGNEVIGTILETETSLDIGLLTLSEPATLVPLITDPRGQSAPNLSIDGRWLAYQSNESGADEIYVRPYPSLDGKWQVSEDGGQFPQWAPDGSRLYYIRGGSIVSVLVETEPTFTFGRGEVVFERPYIAGNFAPTLAPDGKRFLVQKPVETEAVSRQMVVVENWFEDLKRLAPSPARN